MRNTPKITFTLIRGLNSIKSVCPHTAYTQCPIHNFEKGFISEYADDVGTSNTLLCSAGAIKPPGLETLNHKQPIQEQKTKLATGGVRFRPSLKALGNLAHVL